MLSATTNTAALTAQRFLNSSADRTSSSIAKMSSGSRIVKAADDASSLAIGNKLRADISALQQASRNASQGASLLQVANGALDRIGDIMTRLKTLSTQVVNGTLSSTERQFANREFTNLVTQIDEIAEQTRWNDIAMFNGGDKLISEAAISTNASSADITADTTPIDAASSAYFADNAANFTGMVDGAVTDVNVKDIGGQFQIDIEIGDQVFRGLVDDTAASGSVIEFRSTTNSHNGFSLTTDTVYPGGLTAAALETDALAAFDVSDAANPAVRFQSRVTKEADAADFLIDGSNLFTDSIDGSGSTQNGRYSMTSRYDSDTKEFTLRLQHEDGDVQEVKVENINVNDYPDSGTGTNTFRFANGIEITMTDDKIFDATIATVPVDIDGLQFDVASGNSTTLEFQVGVQATDIINISFDPMTAAGLGLTNASIETIEGGKAASAITSAAINKINIATAEIGCNTKPDGIC